jgi:von Willebrand factor type A domain
MNGATVPGLGFSIEIDATSDVAFDADRVEALITVTAHSTGTAAPAARIAEVLVMDRSRSMTSQNKILEARRAACAAIDVLPDGTLLGIIGGNNTAERVFPPAGGLTPVDAATRTAAKRQVMSLWPEGGTKIGGWLTATNGLFATGPATGVIRHAVLYSDGKNEHETREALDDALRICADRFACDVRGLGDDWDYVELLHIAETLGGDATAVIDVADLTDDFTGLMRRAGRLVVPRAYLRLRPDARFRVESISQTHPVQADLKPTDMQADGTVIDVPLGPWEQESRCYQLTLRFEPGSLPVAADGLRATPVELLAETVDGALERRADAALVVRRHQMGGSIPVRPDQPTRFARQRELTFAIMGCVDAWLTGRGADADDELNCAIGLATQLGDVRLGLLRNIATLRPDGKARLRPDATRGQMKQLGLDSVKTGLPAEHVPSPPPDSGRTCPICRGTTYGADPKHCEECGAPFDRTAAS